MAGDWIKMRSGLQTHPKVVRIMSALKADRLRVIGGLHAVWCLFDEHSTDGTLEGYTTEAIDSLIGWPGFSEAMESVGWLEDSGESLCTPRFDEHNGQSAKRRAQESERKRIARNATEQSAQNADKLRTREEKRREEKKEPEDSKALAKKPPTRAHQLPADFYPNETGVEYADTRKVCFAVELESFRNWHNAKGSTMKDWQSAWRTWCDKSVEFGRAGQSKGQATPRMSHADQSKLAAARTIWGTEIEGSHGTENGRIIDITPPARQVDQQDISGATGQLRLAVSEPVEDWPSTG